MFFLLFFLSLQTLVTRIEYMLTKYSSINNNRVCVTVNPSWWYPLLLSPTSYTGPMAELTYIYSHHGYSFTLIQHHHAVDQGKQIQGNPALNHFGIKLTPTIKVPYLIQAKLINKYCIVSGFTSESPHNLDYFGMDQNDLNSDTKIYAKL